MELDTDHRAKVVMVWLTRTEGQDTAIQTGLQSLYRKYKAQGYTVAVFRSGEQNLADVTSSLLCSNRNRIAQAEAKQRQAV